MDAKIFQAILKRLNPTLRHSLNEAAGLCLSRTHYNVEIEHWLLKLLDADAPDLRALLRAFEVREGDLRHQLELTTDSFSSGSTRNPGFSEDLLETTERAWKYASLELGADELRSGHLLLGLLSATRRKLPDALRKIRLEALRADIEDIIGASAESPAPPSDVPQFDEAGLDDEPSETALGRFTTDLTALAREGRIDPVVGRNQQIRALIDVLMRRRQNNPLLAGEAGVGKTAIVEGFALRVAMGDVPPALQGVCVRSLDLGLLQAGAGIRGEFESRLKSVIEEVQGAGDRIILFIDEAHTMIGAGGAAGQNDAANLLKPALARGELRTIAATSWAEYKKSFEKDAALSRRFQAIPVEEPDSESAIAILRGLVPTLETHHGVRILESALEDAVRLSERYLADRQLPDKAISVLDTACARVATSQAATPAALEDLRRSRQMIQHHLHRLERERLERVVHDAEFDALRNREADLAAQATKIEARWKEEARIVAALNACREELASQIAALDDGPAGALNEQATIGRALALTKELSGIQGDDPLVHPHVDADAIASVISAWTGVPLGRMIRDDLGSLKDLGERLKARVLGQDAAVDQVSRRILISRAGLVDPDRPIGVFLLAGPSGVGKTETAHALAQELYGDQRALTVISMSEFKEEHRVSSLTGAPPGYVGHGEGGVLTEAARRRPYGIILLDEIEKAHPSTQEVFYQLFDKGRLRDGDGREIDFRNTILIMTSNAGADLVTQWCSDPELAPSDEALVHDLRTALTLGAHPVPGAPSPVGFQAAFLGRTTLLAYRPLAEGAVDRIVRLQLDRISTRLMESHAIPLVYDEDAVRILTERVGHSDRGARDLIPLLESTVLEPLSRLMLEALARPTHTGSAVRCATLQGTTIALEEPHV